MSKPASNVSFDGQAVTLQLSCPYIVLIDPLALDGLRDQLQSLEGRTSTDQRALLEALSVPLRIGVHEVKDFRPGFFRVTLSDFEYVKGPARDPGIVEIDSGTMVLADLAHLASVARVLTWERYDRALQAPAGDDTPFHEMEAEVGGPFFAVLSGSADSPFKGDGAFRLLSTAPTIME
jgi:hypothetical protein